MSVPIVIVAAVAKNGVIGVGGGLPWKIRADLKRFRAITMGKPVVMGRKTFESIGRVLDGRDVIVVTRQTDFNAPGILIADSLDTALKLAGERAAARGAGEVCIGGGGEIYRAALPLAERLYLTHVAIEPAGDTVFPAISPAEWTEISREPLPPTEGDTATAEHAVYARRR